MDKVSYIPLKSAPEGFVDYSAYKDIFGYDSSCEFYGAFYKGQQVGYGAVRDGELLHVSSVSEEINEGLRRTINFFLHKNAKDTKPKEPKDLINAPIPFVYDVHKKHVQIGYEGEEPRDVKPYRGEFSKGGVVEGHYHPGGKLVIYPANAALYTTRQIINAWTKQFPQMMVTSVEIEHEGKTHKVPWKTQTTSDNNSNPWGLERQTSSTVFTQQDATLNTPPQTQTFSSDQSKTPTKQSMAADPDWLNSWIAANGPYAYHSFGRPKVGESISEKGLLPWDHPENPSKSPYVGALQPRANHAYMGVAKEWPHPEHGRPWRGLHYKQPWVARIDLRKLDPSKLNADEDSLARFRRTPDSTPYNREGYDSYGAWADAFPEYANHPLNVQRSMEGWNTFAHEGPVPPEAIEIMPYMQAMEEEHKAAQQRAESQWRTAAKAPDAMPPGQFVQVLAAIDPAASVASEALRYAGGKVYVVGGAVRDVLRGSEPKDIDLMVGGLPEHEVNDILSKLPGHVDVTGKRFGVYRYRHDGHEVEIALPRQDKYETSQRGKGIITVDHHLPVEKDLQRRDFTVNSMAVDLDNGELIDPHGGQRDLEKNILRTSHPDSFREDPTRLVRALIAHSRFGLHPDETTRAEMAANAHLLRGESPDALNSHLDKLFASHSPAAALRLAHDTGVLKHLFPEVDEAWDYDQNNDHHESRLGEHLMQVLNHVSGLTSDPDLRMAALLHDIGKPASAWTDPVTNKNHFYEKHWPDGTVSGADHETVGAKMAEDRLRELNYPVNRIKRVTHLIQHHMFPEFTTQPGARRFLNRAGDAHADDLLLLRQGDMAGKTQEGAQRAAVATNNMRGLVDEVRKGQQPTDLKNLAINGNTLIQMGIPSGPQIGAILRQLLDHVIEVPADNNPAALETLAMQFARASS